MRNKDQWQQYINDHLQIDQPMQQRGFVAGDNIDQFVDNGIHLVNQILRSVDINILSGSILDVGCANGRLPIGLCASDISPKSYIGTDVMPQPIHFCNRAFKDYPNFYFIHTPAYNSRYSKYSKANLQDVQLPIGEYDLVVANSVFTHLGFPKNAELYLKKITDAIPVGCTTYITWFKSPPNQINYGEKRTVYNENLIKQFYNDNNLKITAYYDGLNTDKRNQWKITAVKE